MSKEKKNTQNEKRKLSRQERKQIDTLIRQAKGDGKPHTAQDSIPFERMYKDGICRLANGRYSKCIEFEDINYQLAQPDDKTAIFEALCDMYNSFDASISVQLSLISRHANKDDFKNSITIAPQNDDFDSIRAEYTEMLRTQLERGNNGLIKTKFLTFTVEAKDIRSARARLARIETDTLNHFKVIGAAARVLDGKPVIVVGGVIRQLTGLPPQGHQLPDAPLQTQHLLRVRGRQGPLMQLPDALADSVGAGGIVVGHFLQGHRTSSFRSPHVPPMYGEKIRRERKNTVDKRAFIW